MLSFTQAVHTLLLGKVVADLQSHAANHSSAAAISVMLSVVLGVPAAAVSRVPDSLPEQVPLLQVRGGGVGG